MRLRTPLPAAFPLALAHWPLAPGPRRGLSLLEVIVAMAIFLFALVALGRLVSMSTDLAEDVRDYSRAAVLCQGKLAEAAAGVVPLQGTSDAPFDDEEGWTWSLTASQGNVAAIWNVEVTVTRQRPDNTKVECTLAQMVLDPAQRGTATAPATAASSSTSGTSGATSGTGTGTTKGN